MCWHRTSGQKLLSLAPLLISCRLWLQTTARALVWLVCSFQGGIAEREKQCYRGRGVERNSCASCCLKVCGAVWPGPASHQMQMFPACWIPSGGEQKRRRLLSMGNGHPWLGSAAMSQRVRTQAVPIQLACLLTVGREGGLWMVLE